MSYQNQLTKDLDYAERWWRWTHLERVVASLDNGDEFGFFWHRVSIWATRYADDGPPEPRVDNDTVRARVIYGIQSTGVWA